MSMRFYQPVQLQLGEMQLSEEASHHLARVLRAAVNDEIILFNGEGGEYDAVIQSITKKAVIVNIRKFISRDVESPLKIILAQGIARGEKMDFVMQKAVEMGVSEIIPVITERCSVRLEKEREQKRLQHWQTVVVSACEQSGRNRVPVVYAPQTLSTWLDQCQADVKFVLSPHVKNKLNVKNKPESAAVLIGPEGGLSNQEVEAAIRQGFSALNLGPRVLRTETAALAVLAVLQFKFGDYA